jgi:hypothetical protein
MATELSRLQDSGSGWAYKQDVGGSSPSLPTNPLESASSADVFHGSQLNRSADSAVALIPLTQGYSALVDPEDFRRFAHLKWTATVQKRADGSLRVYAYRLERGADGKWHNYFLHRAVMDAAPGQKFDHEDRNTLNCRRYNLRPATYSQNAANTSRRPGKYGFLGVDSQTPGAYRGRVYADGRSYTTKTFPSPVLAAVARDVLARELHGEFAVFNFPQLATGGCGAR